MPRLLPAAAWRPLGRTDMNRSRWIAIFFAATVVLAGGLAQPQPAAGQNPFYYYPAYGAQRGKIVYRDGLLVNRQKIRWGNGLTPYGAAVLMHGFDVAGTVIPAVIGSGGGGSSPVDDGGSLGNESAEATQEKCEAALERTKELLENTQRICCRQNAEAAAQPAAAYAQVENAKRRVAEALPVIERLQHEAQQQKAAVEKLEAVLARDRKIFADFIEAIQAAP